jgi:DNA-binding transcriptional MerR regulator
MGALHQIRELVMNGKTCALLQIGEIARLSGVTPKTVRYYTRLGLLPEPQRTESGYRLYTARDLLRLHRIRQLQGLGLSLAHIKELLGEPEQERALKNVLEFLQAEIAAQMKVLEERQEKIKNLLAAESLETLDRSPNLPPAIEMTRQYLETHTIKLSPAAWEQEKQMWELLDKFRWPTDINQLQAMAIQFIETNPEVMGRWMNLMERFAALAQLPENNPEIEAEINQVVAEFGQIGSSEQIAQDFKNFAWMEGTMGKAMLELWASTLSPLQQRVLAEVEKQKVKNEPASNHNN